MYGLLSYKTWLIEPMFANRMAPIILRSIEQGTLDKFINHNKESNEKIISGLYAGIQSQRESVDDGPSYRLVSSQSKKSIALVSFQGSITKNGESCSYGMRDYQNTLATIAKNARVSGVVLHFNNAPGGSNDGTSELSEMIASFPKSIVAFVDGYAASAHYWMASQAKHIMMNVKTDSEVGSIGSLLISENIQNMVEAGNFPKVEIIRAPQSINKALLNIIEPISDDVRKELNAELKQAVDGFISAVKLGRGDRLKDDGLMFTGKMYQTDEAIANGLADSKGTLQDAINKAAEGGASAQHPKSTKSFQSQSNNKSNNKLNMSFKSKVSSFFNPKGKQSAEGDAPAAEDSTPMWTDTMVFYTDGSGDGAFCLHTDDDGTDRKFETKTDSNTGNEPPTDPATTEDDNWSVVAEAAAPDDTAPAAQAQETSVTKLNVALKAANMKVKNSTAEVVSLVAKVAKLEASLAAMQKKMDATPAAGATTIVESSTRAHVHGANSWEQKANKKFKTQ